MKRKWVKGVVAAGVIMHKDDIHCFVFQCF